ncbi:hypothetical protein D3C73_638990 [compost metagenome]
MASRTSGPDLKVFHSTVAPFLAKAASIRPFSLAINSGVRVGLTAMLTTVLFLDELSLGTDVAPLLLSLLPQPATTNANIPIKIPATNLFPNLLFPIPDLPLMDAIFS